MSTDSSFGRVLAEFRKRQGMSRSQLAERSGLSYPYVSQLETGLRKPSRKAAAQLAEALGIEPLALEAALPPDDMSSPSFQRSLAAQAALLSGDSQIVSALEPIDDVPMGGAPTRRSTPRRTGRDDLVGQAVDLIEELPPEERLDALGDVQKLVLKRMLEEHSREA
jgi:transcriptional regulator with XRE-family HTH domain